MSDSRSAFEQQRLELMAHYGFPARSRWLHRPDGRFIYTMEAGEGPVPTVLIHGGLSEGSEWVTLAGRLDGRVIVVDRPGWGLSDPDENLARDFPGTARSWMADLLDAIGADQVDLVANSMGGFFAIALASVQPECVRRLVLAGAPAGLDRSVPVILRLWGNPVIGPIMAGLGVTVPPDAEAFRRRVFRMILVAQPDRLPVEYLETALAAWRLPGVGDQAHWLLHTALNLRGWRPELSNREACAALTVPTLFLWGDRDAFAPGSSGQDIVRRMRDARIAMVPEAGHMPYLDQPEFVAERMRAFLADGARPPTQRAAAVVKARPVPLTPAL